MKNKLILLVSMLLPLVSSCGEKPTVEQSVEPTVIPSEPTPEIVYNYKESEYSTYLNSLNYNVIENFEPTYADSQLGQFIHSKNHSFVQYSGKKNEDYYLCAYIYHNDLEFMNYYLENPYNEETGKYNEPLPYDAFYNNKKSIFRGINGTLKQMNIFKNYGYIKELYPNHIFKDIVWYEIPKDDEIPMIIGEYELSLISEIYYFDFYDLDKNHIGKKPYLIECIDHQIYQNIKAHSQETMEIFNNFIGKISERHFYIFDKDYSNDLEIYSSLNYSLSKSIVPFQIDGKEYVKLYEYNVIGDNLLEKYELINTAEGVYAIKYVDFVDFLKSLKNS